MKIYVAGNSLVKEDSLPLKLIPNLKKELPKFEIVEIDPNEDFVPEDSSVIIDTVVGINEVTLFTDIDQFADHKLVSPHDYDLGFHLKFLKKMGKIINIKIIGVPQAAKKNQVINDITNVLKDFLRL